MCGTPGPPLAHCLGLSASLTGLTGTLILPLSMLPGSSTVPRAWAESLSLDEDSAAYQLCDLGHVTLTLLICDVGAVTVVPSRDYCEA